MTREYTRQETYPPGVVGLDGAILTAERTSAILGCKGYTHLTLHTELTWSAAATVSIQVDTRVRSGNSTTYSRWTPNQSGTTAAGVRTLDDLIDRKTVAANDEWSTSFEVAADQCRIRITSAGGAEGDTARVWVTFACR